MATLTHRTEIELAGEELLGLADIRGTRLHCLEGRVWVTLDRDLRDVFLDPGDSLVVDRDGVTLLHALSPARLSVATARAATKRVALPGWLRSAARLLRRLLGGGASPLPAGA